MMTKQDYIIIASVLRDNRPAVRTCSAPVQGVKCGECRECITRTAEVLYHARLTTNMMSALARQNPRFSDDKFRRFVNDSGNEIEYIGADSVDGLPATL